MHRPLNRHWIREVDRRAIHEYGMSGLVLMENAARGAVDVLLDIECRGPVVIFCGKGNNGGDGFAMARHLDGRGVAVRVVLTVAVSDLQGDAAANFAVLQKCQVPLILLRDAESTLPAVIAKRVDQALAGCEWIVDALLGTGASGPPRPPLDAILAQLNQHSARKLAIDLPSGLDCDSGAPVENAFRAHHTVTFVAPKPGLLAPPAQPYVGQLHVVDIGAPRVLIEEIMQQADQT
jgi:NAD(P)H-hydrate epimerase